MAHVYVGTSNGVYLYDAASNGALTRVSGSPFAIAGSAVGGNGHYFVSLGTAYLHSYPVASNGAIKGQVSQINTNLYSGSECGTAQGAVLDPSGEYVYVQRYSATPVGSDQEACAALQSFKTASSGSLSFLGATQFATETETGLNTATTTLISLSGNGRHAYSASYDHDCSVVTWEFNRESSGAMLFSSSEHLMVPSTPPDWAWYPFVMTADPTNHLAVAMFGESGDFSPCGDVIHLTQLASFTVASDGNLATTNTPENMPTPQVHPQVMNISPSGQFLAVGGTATFSGEEGTQTPGLQVFRFNGANPITPYSKVLTTAPIDEIHWDNNNHLYALSNSTRKLYVYTVTSTSITAAPGSPYTIASSPNALVIVPILCSLPSSDGIHMCDPGNGSSVNSPVLVEAAATVTGTIARMELWVDGSKKYTAASSHRIDTTVSLDIGSHRFAVLAFNTAGQKWENVAYANVVPSLCSAPSSDGVNICDPASGSTVGSPVLVEAAATVPGTIARMELWVDGAKQYTATSSKQLSTTLSLAAGSHRFAVIAVNTVGQRWENAVYATVK
ncbi:MAG: Ig-like domain-containing protein [Acidobacteriaceae bacterium]